MSETNESTAPDPDRWFLQGVAVGCMVVLAFATTVLAARFREIFASMNVELPLVSQALIGFGDFLESQWYVAIPFGGLAAFVMTWPLRLVPREKRRGALLLTIGAAVLGAIVIVLALYLPIVKLQAALAK